MEVASWPFVGRGDMIDLCCGALGARRSVLVAGPAGVGKTRLVREIADRFESSCRVVRVVASLSGGIPLIGLADTDDPALLVIDDVPLLDNDTAAVVASMVIAGEVILLGTMRTEAGSVSTGAPAMTLLWKDDHVTRLDLSALTRAQFDALLDAALPGAIDVRTRFRLWDLTRGSPLFLRELIRSSISDGTLGWVGGMWRLVGELHSKRLDELIEQRLSALEPAARVVVEIVALGEPVSFAAMLRDGGVDALDEAERNGLVEVVVDELRRDVRMVHPVFADVARRHLTAARAAAHHARLLAMVEATPMRRRDDIVRAAMWQMRSGGTPVSDDMILAARRALYDRNEWLAIELASQAASSRQVDAAIVVSQAFAELGQPERAVRLLSEFGGELSETDRALLAIQRSVASFWGLGDAATAEQLLLDAEAEITNGSWRDELRAERAVFAATQGHLARALAIGGDLVDESKPARVFVTAAIAGAVAFALDGRSVDSAALAARAFEVGSTLTPELGMSDPSIHVVAQALALSEAGELSKAEELARIARDFSVADGNRTGQAWFSLVLGRVMLLRGRPSEALPLFNESAASFGWMHSPGPQGWAIAGVVQSSVLLGNFDAAELAWADLADVVDHPAQMMGIEVERAGAWMRVARGDVNGAIGRLIEVADIAFDAGNVSLGGAVLHDIVRLGGSVDHRGIGLLAEAQGALAPARSAAAMASQQADPAAVQAVGEMFGTIGADLFASEMFHRAEALFIARGARRDATRCAHCAAEMHRATNEDWIVTLALDTDVDPATSSSPTALTEREREIATLAAAGRTNREIAIYLFVSIRTVENHLQHVYDKLGVSGRRDLPESFATAIV